MIRRLLGILAVLVIATSPVQGQVYQWVDENGVRHYSNTPPPEGVTDLRTYEELQSEIVDEPSAEGEEQSSAEAEDAGSAAEAATLEGGGEPEKPIAETPEQPPVENPATAEPSVAGEEQSSAEAEDTGSAQETATLEEAGNTEEPIAPDAEENLDIEEESPENPTTGQVAAGELIEQERDRLEVRMVQLSRQLEEAQIARDRGSSYEVEQWNKRIEQLQDQIEKEKSRSEARIEQIRNNPNLQP